MGRWGQTGLEPRPGPVHLGYRLGSPRQSECWQACRGMDGPRTSLAGPAGTQASVVEHWFRSGVRWATGRGPGRLSSGQARCISMAPSARRPWMDLPRVLWARWGHRQAWWSIGPGLGSSRARPGGAGLGGAYWAGGPGPDTESSRVVVRPVRRASGVSVGCGGTSGTGPGSSFGSGAAGLSVETEKFAKCRSDARIGSKELASGDVHGLVSHQHREANPILWFWQAGCGWGKSR